MKSILRRSPRLAAAGLMLFLAACGSAEPAIDEAPADDLAEAQIEPVEVEAEAPLVLGPWLSVTGAGVSLAASEDAALEALADGETVALADGSHLTVEPGARAELGWPAVEGEPESAFAHAEILGGSDLRVESSDPEVRSLRLELLDGTGRFRVPEGDTPSHVSVRDTVIGVHGSAAGTAFIFSHDPADGGKTAAAASGAALQTSQGSPSDDAAAPAGHVWVIVSSGKVQVSTIESVAAAGSAGATKSVSLSAGQAAAFDAEGKVALAIALEPEAIADWFAGRAEGSVTTAIAELPVEAPVAEAVPVSAAAVPAEPVVSFTADRTTIAAGECTTVRWSVTEVLFVTFEGRDVPDASSEQVCPTESWTYTLAHVGVDGKDRTNYVGIKVTNPNAAVDNQDEDNDPPAPPPTATPCVGEECEVIEPPVSDDPSEGPPEPEPLPTLAPVDPVDPPAPEPPAPEPTPEPPDPIDPPAPDPGQPPAPEPPATEAP